MSPSRLANVLPDAMAFRSLSDDRARMRAVLISAAGAPPIDYVSIDVPQLLARVAARAPEHVRVRAPNTLPLRADPEQLEEAVMRLLDNAFRHGSPPVELAAMLTEDGCVCLTVTDGGAGPTAGVGALVGSGLDFVREVAVAHGGATGADGGCAWIAVPTFGGACRSQ